MKRVAFVVLALTLAVLAAAAPQALDAAKLTGRWRGDGVFFKADLRDQLGPIPLTVEFKADHSATGAVGGATMQSAHVASSTRTRIEVTAKLAGAISADPRLAKDHLALIITAITDSTVQAEFHLKSNAVLDPRMREGRVTLTRVRDR